jgi:predicted RNA-binding Zn-ribbon protein involved in translation (DUF1610 family)
VGDLGTHERLRCDPDGYRPTTCPSCGHHKLHVHDYPERKRLVITLVRYLCPACGATWRMLPLFVARMLWRSWPTVETATIGPASPAAVRVPERTVRRWRARLQTAAASLVEVLHKAGEAALVAVAAAVDATATRLRLAIAYAKIAAVPTGQQLSRLAATIHRLVPGVRLM